MTKKEKDLSKVTSLASGEYLRAVTSTGESVLINKSDLYPTFSATQDGLVPKEYYTMMVTHSFVVPANGEIDTKLTFPGLIQVKAPTLTGNPAIGILCLYGLEINIVFDSTAIRFNSDGPHLTVYKKEADGTLWIKNNRENTYTVQIRYI